MKKILTTALLLSAGTALSQAATLLTDTSSYTSTMGFTFSNQSSGTQTMAGAGISVSVTGVEASFSYASENTRNYYSSKTASTQTWAPNTNVGNGYPWTVCITISNQSSNDYSFDALQLGMSGLDSFGNAQNNANGLSAGSYSGTVVANEGATTYKLVDMTVGYYLDETTYSPDSTDVTSLVTSIAYDMANTSSSPSTGTFSFDTITIASGASLTFVFTASQNSSSGYGTFAGITTLSLGTTAVPEPSTFGLLAGLGALAMVAARRRRRR